MEIDAYSHNTARIRMCGKYRQDLLQKIGLRNCIVVNGR
jgi:hypothetical protein